MPPTGMSDMAAPVTMGRISGGHAADMMTRPPFMRPAAPIPVIALPMMNTGLVGERAHARLPSSNTIKKARYVYLELISCYDINGNFAQTLLDMTVYT
jgi:hypothetical protein